LTCLIILRKIYRNGNRVEIHRVEPRVARQRVNDDRSKVHTAIYYSVSQIPELLRSRLSNHSPSSFHHPSPPRFPGELSLFVHCPSIPSEKCIYKYPSNLRYVQIITRYLARSRKLHADIIPKFWIYRSGKISLDFLDI